MEERIDVIGRTLDERTTGLVDILGRQSQGCGEEQGRRQCETQDRVGHAHRYVTTYDDARQRAREQ